MGNANDVIHVWVTKGREYSTLLLECSKNRNICKTILLNVYAILNAPELKDDLEK